MRSQSLIITSPTSLALPLVLGTSFVLHFIWFLRLQADFCAFAAGFLFTVAQWVMQGHGHEVRQNRKRSPEIEDGGIFSDIASGIASLQSKLAEDDSIVLSLLISTLGTSTTTSDSARTSQRSSSPDTSNPFITTVSDPTPVSPTFSFLSTPATTTTARSPVPPSVSASAFSIPLPEVSVVVAAGKHQLSSGAVAGIAVIVVLFLVCASITLLQIRRRRLHHRVKLSDAEMTGGVTMISPFKLLQEVRSFGSGSATDAGFDAGSISTTIITRERLEMQLHAATEEELEAQAEGDTTSGPNTGGEGVEPVPPASDSAASPAELHAAREFDARSISTTTTTRQRLQMELRAATEKMVDLEQLAERGASSNARGSRPPSTASALAIPPPDLQAELRAAREQISTLVTQIHAMNSMWGMGMGDELPPEYA
ncbi:hypothetical protein MSAN_01094300 [Mycena sanguinolenta]|uniref:Transmembrane protein n=1 Tax=Mycena sanguinolenta TaxID=230812 RepID=A0A8H6YUY6_9AGAR|nr:hypothetical protein MSAN_01094300 [Mycena sanguinolenta]